MSKPKIPFKTGDGEELPEDLIDPSEVKDDQSELQFAWRNVQAANEMANGSSVETGTDLLAEWLPRRDEYHGKTDISLNQARPIALILQFEQMFPNIVGDGVYHEIIESIENYEQLLTSWEGSSREQQVEVLKNVNADGRRDKQGALEHVFDALERDG